MSRALKDYYAVLHVQPGAPVEIIRASYRTLMQQLKAHPDLGGDAGTAAEINEAYAVLKDATKRAAYDAERAGSTTGHGNGHAAAEPRADGAGQSKTGAPGAAFGTDASSCTFCRLPHAPKERSAERCSRCGSPLVRALPAIEMSDRTQRALHRVNKDEPLRFFKDWQEHAGHVGVLLDLSLTGLRFAAPEFLAVGQIVRIECALFSAVARVARCERGRELLFQVGAEFVTVLFHRQRGSLVSIPV
jgi:DnaJ domain/PilZ domain